MKYSLSNDWIGIEVLSKGAEWCRLYDVKKGTEFIWSADPQVWGKYAPLLFPIVGTLKEGVYVHEGEEYALPRHGFARDRRFELVKQESRQLIFELKADEESLAVYPFLFKLQVSYTLKDRSLRVDYTVVNEGENEMLFSIGGHPAFRIPFLPGTQYHDYLLAFEKVEQAGRWPISAAGLIEREALPFFEGQQQIPLTKSLFERDALVFKHLHSQYVDLLENQTREGLRFHFGEFPFLGLWAASGADFLCIEPWQGIADSVDHRQVLKDKEGIMRLAPSDTYQAGWTVELIG